MPISSQLSRICGLLPNECYDVTSGFLNVHPSEKKEKNLLENEHDSVTTRCFHMWVAHTCKNNVCTSHYWQGLLMARLLFESSMQQKRLSRSNWRRVHPHIHTQRQLTSCRCFRCPFLILLSRSSFKRLLLRKVETEKERGVRWTSASSCSSMHWWQ